MRGLKALLIYTALYSVLTTIVSCRPESVEPVLPVKSSTPAKKDAALLAATSTNAVTIPGTIPNTPCHDSLKLAQCVNTLIETKTTEPLRIQIRAGTYSLSDTILIFQRDDVIIQGSTRPDGKNQVTLVPSPELLPTRDGRVLQYFLMNIINSQRITIQGLNLNGMSPTHSGLRGIAVCPVASQQISGIEIRNLEASRFSNIFTLVGNSYDDHLLSVMNGPAYTPGITRLKEYLQSLPDTQRYCTGSTSNVKFESNQLSLENVGFYVIPYTSKTTANRILRSSSTEDPHNPGLEDWKALVDEIADKHTGIVIRNNTFTAKFSTSPGRSQQESLTHSAVKIHYTQGLVIDGNTFDAGNNLRYTFGGGAAVNLSAGARNTVITNNKIIFPNNHAYKSHGIGIWSGHQTHSLYGVGTIGLFSAALNTRIANNHFVNGLIRVWDACVNSPQKPNTTWFCDDMNATPGHAKNDDIVVSGNTKSRTPTSPPSSASRELLWRVCVDEQLTFVKPANVLVPGQLYCRKTIGATFP